MLRHHLCLLLLPLVSATALGQVTLKLSVGGTVIGTVTAGQHLTAAGNKVIEVQTVLKRGDKEARLVTRSEYAADGTPVEMFESFVPDDSSGEQHTNVEFDSAGAHAARNAGDGWKSKDLELDAKRSRACTYEFWFLRDQPKTGDKVTAFYFDVDKLAWVDRTTTYVGPTNVSINGKLLPSFHIRTTSGDQVIDAYVDDKGRPLRITNGDTEMVRSDL
jgi:hypothetical protein